MRLDKVIVTHVRVHTHQFEGYDCNNHKDHCGEGRFNPLKHAAQTSACCSAAAHVPPARDLRLNHYQYKSVACAQEKAARNGHRNSALDSIKEARLAEVYDDAILPFVPPRYKEPCLTRGLHCREPPAATFLDVRDIS